MSESVLLVLTTIPVVTVIMVETVLSSDFPARIQRHAFYFQKQNNEKCCCCNEEERNEPVLEAGFSCNYPASLGEK